MKEESVAIWNQILSSLREKVNPQSFTTWLKPVSPLSFENGKLTLQVPSQFFYEWLEQHYGAIINQELVNLLGPKAKLVYSIVVNQKNEPIQLPSLRKKEVSSEGNGRLNDRFTFDRFVEGDSNKFAKAAGLAVAEAPGKTSFNPLVIYGGVGLGKTHLIQAIANFAKSEGTAQKVLYVSMEEFTQDFINSIKKNRTTEFSGNYRNVGVLLVDDIHFLTNKERTQEEFFHTFNALYQKGKQIVLSSDRPPKELKGIEERLISRFQWGLIVDIQPPDFETRHAILQRKAEETGINLSDEILHFIATHITSNIRELEGSLIRLLAYSSLYGKDITLELAKEVLRDICIPKTKVISIEDIQKYVSEHFNIPDDMLRAKTRKKEIAIARQIAMFLCKKFTDHSLKTIGLHFGGRDHSTVIHAMSNIEALQKADKNLREAIEIIKRKIEISHL